MSANFNCLTFASELSVLETGKNSANFNCLTFASELSALKTVQNFRKFLMAVTGTVNC
jgi:hypothetical protein